MGSFTASVILTCRDPLPFPVRHFIVTPEHPVAIGRYSNNGKDTKDRSVASASNAVFDKPIVSRKHAELVLGCWSGRLMIKDRGSLHGTYLNGLKLAENDLKTVNNGDVITLGKYEEPDSKKTSQIPASQNGIKFVISYIQHDNRSTMETTPAPVTATQTAVVDLSSPVPTSPSQITSKAAKRSTAVYTVPDSSSESGDSDHEDEECIILEDAATPQDSCIVLIENETETRPKTTPLKQVTVVADVLDENLFDSGEEQPSETSNVAIDTSSPHSAPQDTYQVQGLSTTPSEDAASAHVEHSDNLAEESMEPVMQQEWPSSLSESNAQEVCDDTNLELDPTSPSPNALRQGASADYTVEKAAEHGQRHLQISEDSDSSPKPSSTGPRHSRSILRSPVYSPQQVKGNDHGVIRDMTAQPSLRLVSDDSTTYPLLVPPPHTTETHLPTYDSNHSSCPEHFDHFADWYSNARPQHTGLVRDHWYGQQEPIKYPLVRTSWDHILPEGHSTITDHFHSTTDLSRMAIPNIVDPIPGPLVGSDFLTKSKIQSHDDHDNSSKKRKLADFAPITSPNPAEVLTKATWTPSVTSSTCATSGSEEHNERSSLRPSVEISTNPANLSNTDATTQTITSDRVATADVSTETLRKRARFTSPVSTYVNSPSESTYHPAASSGRLSSRRRHARSKKQRSMASTAATFALGALIGGVGVIGALVALPESFF